MLTAPCYGRRMADASPAAERLKAESAAPAVRVGGATRAEPPVRSLALRIKAILEDRSDERIAQIAAGNVFLVRVASAGLALGSQVLLARWMGRFEYGVFIYVWTWVVMIGSLSDMGLSSAARRFIPEYTERGKAAHLRGFLSGSRWLAFAISAGPAGAGAVRVYLPSARLTPFTVVPLYLACAVIPMWGLGQIQTGIAQSYEWTNLALVPFYILRQLAMTLAVGGAWWLGFPTGAVIAMAAAVVTNWVVTLGQGVWLDRRLRGRIAAGNRNYEVKSWLGTSLPIFVVESFYLLLTYVDILA